MLKSYGDRIKVVYKDFPLLEIHPWAERAAIDSECLAKQSAGAYWDFADYVHANGQQIQGDKRPVSAQLGRVGPDHDGHGQAALGGQGGAGELHAGASEDRSEGQHERGRRLGVEATPAMFVNGLKIDGAVPEEELKLVLDKELKNVGAGGSGEGCTRPG